MQVFIVYLITNLRNGKRYVGKTNEARRRWMTHLGNARRGLEYPLYSAIRKYGADSFVFMVLACDLTEDRAFELERAWIAEYRTFERDHGYNLSLGGEGVAGRPMPEHVKRALAEGTRRARAWLGRKHRPDSIEKIAQARRARPAALYAPLIARLAEGHRGRTLTPEHRAKLAEKAVGHTRNVGRKHTPEARARMCAAQRVAAKTRVFSAEALARIAAGGETRRAKNPRRIALEVDEQ